MCHPATQYFLLQTGIICDKNLDVKKKEVNQMDREKHN